uniref:LIM zinc-binding domain-containing protein n=1 Tax=Xiphophorus couchianus TaxID=32473 RepID=A0A3B5KS19_9TELE
MPASFLPDALLADLENTSSPLPRCPVLLTSDPPQNSNANSHDSAQARPPPPAYTPQQTVSAAMKSSTNSNPDKLYSTVCKPRSPRSADPAPAFSSSLLGGGLNELDHLLQELNATQFNITGLRLFFAFYQPTPPVSQVVTAPQRPATPPQQSAAPAQPTPGGSLDSMLGLLQSDLSRQGVQTSSKGNCSACQKPVVGQVVTALGKVWHPEHFVCTQCEMELGSRNFFEKDGRPYCESDYFTLFSPHCANCSKPILNKMVTALDKNWHPECFCCVKCSRTFGDEGFHDRDGQQYCQQCFLTLFASRCQGCSEPILENYISALNSLWHPQCFVCRECYSPFVNGSFFEHEGKPLCEAHYHQSRGSMCQACQQPILGRCVTAMGAKFHPHHLVCQFCMKPLSKGCFKEQENKPYCHPCFIKLFG